MPDSQPGRGGIDGGADEGREAGAATAGEAATLAGRAARAGGPGRAATTARRQTWARGAAMTAAVGLGPGGGPQAAGPGQNRTDHYDHNQAAGERGSFHRKYFIQVDWKSQDL